MNIILVKVQNIELIINNTYLYNSIDYSLEEGKEIYNNDGTFSHVRIDDNISVNIWDNEIKKQLKNLIGKCFIITESGSKIYIDKDFPGEYIYSKSSLSLNNKKKIIKTLIIPYINLILNNCYNRLYSSNYKIKHNKDGKFGFYKYQINFSIIFNNFEEIYTATIVIRNDANKKKYLYDTISIKKN